MDNPYDNLPPEAFWRTAVAGVRPFGISGLWRAKFPIGRDDGVVTAESCVDPHGLTDHFKPKVIQQVFQIRSRTTS